MATDQNQNIVNPTGHSNPETAGDLGALVRFATRPMTSTSMPNQADQSQNNQLNIWELDSFGGWGEARTYGACGIQRDDDGMNFQREDGAEHSQQTSQPNEARLSQQPLNQHQRGAEHSHQHQGGQSLVHRSNSLQSPSGGDQGDQFQAGQSNSQHSAMGGVPKLSHQHQVGPSLVHRSNSLQSTMGAVRLSEQLLNRAGQIHTDLSNPSQYTSDRMMRFEETRQLQWSQEEPCRDSGPTTCDKKLAAEERKKKTRSEYNEREKGKKVLSAEIFDKLKRGEDVRSQEYVHRIPEPPSKSKFQQQIHRPSYSAPAAVTNQTESHIYEVLTTTETPDRLARLTMEQIPEMLARPEQVLRR